MKNFKTKEASVEAPKPGNLGGPLTGYMTSNLVTFKPDTPILDAVNTLVERKISGAPVLNDKREVVGMIDEKDCLRVLLERAYHNQPVRAHKVSDYMDDVMRPISMNADILHAATIFLESTYKRLLVVDDRGKLVGLISRSDVLRAVRDLNKS